MAAKRAKGLIFTGSEGTMEIGGRRVTVSRVPRETGPGLTIDTFTEAMQKQIRGRVREEVSACAS